MINTLSPLPRPYIGSHRYRYFIDKKIPLASPLSTNIFQSNSYLSRPLIPKDYSSKLGIVNSLSIQKKNLFSHDEISSSIQVDERITSEHKEKDFPSLFLPVLITSDKLVDQNSLVIPTKETRCDTFDSNNSSIERYTRYQSSIDASISNRNQSINDHQRALSSTSFNDEYQLPSQSTNLQATFSSNKHQTLNECPLQSIFHYPSDSYRDKTLEKSNPIDSFCSRSESVRTMSQPSYVEQILDQNSIYLIKLKSDDFEEKDFLVTPIHSCRQLVVDAKHRDEDKSGGYVHRELHKIFSIPNHVDFYRRTETYDRLTKQLIIAMPHQTSTKTRSINNQTTTFSYTDNLSKSQEICRPTSAFFDTEKTFKEPNENKTSALLVNNAIPTALGSLTEWQKTKPFDLDTFRQSIFRPEIISTQSKGNKLRMTLDLMDYQPEDIKISIKDQELIVRAERNSQNNTKKSKISFYQSTSLPPQTDIEHLQSNYIDGKLFIEAPFLELSTKNFNQKISDGKIFVENQGKLLTNEPFQQRTVTIKEYVRRL